MRVVRAIAVGLVALECNLVTAFACPMCKAALEEDPSKPLAFQTSILFMLAMIMAAVGAVTFLLVVVNRRETLMMRESDLLTDVLSSSR